MIRRSPTRIELKLDDLNEYETVKDPDKKSADRQSLFATTWNNSKPSQSEIHERIGYVPQQPQTTHPRPTI